MSISRIYISIVLVSIATAHDPIPFSELPRDEAKIVSKIVDLGFTERTSRYKESIDAGKSRQLKDRIVAARRELTDTQNDLKELETSIRSLDAEDQKRSLETHVANLDAQLEILERHLEILTDRAPKYSAKELTQKRAALMKSINRKKGTCVIHPKQLLTFTPIRIRYGCVFYSEAYTHLQWHARRSQFPNAPKPIDGGAGSGSDTPKNVSIPVCALCTKAWHTWERKHIAIRPHRHKD